MKKQGNTFPKKEQDKSPGKNLNEMEISDLSDSHKNTHWGQENNEQTK